MQNFPMIIGIVLDICIQVSDKNTKPRLGKTKFGMQRTSNETFKRFMDKCEIKDKDHFFDILLSSYGFDFWILGRVR